MSRPLLGKAAPQLSLYLYEGHNSRHMAPTYDTAAAMAPGVRVLWVYEVSISYARAYVSRCKQRDNEGMSVRRQISGRAAGESE